jgi:hypothetical protein
MNTGATQGHGIRTTCPQCGTSNLPTAKFCGACGGSLTEGPTPPPLPPPPPPNNRFDWNRGGGLGSLDNQTTVRADGATAYERSLAALHSLGADVKWTAAPREARFAIQHKENGVTVRYHGALTVTPVAPAQTTVQIDLRTDWGSVVPVVIGSIILIFALGWLMFPLLLVFAMPLSVLTAVYTVWWAASQVPSRIVERVVKRIEGGSAYEPEPKSRWAGIVGRRSTGRQQAGPAAHHPMPAAPHPRGVPRPHGDPSPAGAPNVLEQIRQLARARDEGLITPEEFEAKKVELLSRL